MSVLGSLLLSGMICEWLNPVPELRVTFLQAEYVLFSWKLDCCTMSFCASILPLPLQVPSLGPFQDPFLVLVCTNELFYKQVYFIADGICQQPETLPKKHHSSINMFQKYLNENKQPNEILLGSKQRLASINAYVHHSWLLFIS